MTVKKSPAKKPVAKKAVTSPSIAAAAATFAPAARLIEDPTTKLLFAAPGVDPKTLTVEERCQMAARITEQSGKLTKVIDHSAQERFEAERAERERIAFSKTKEARLGMFVIAALGRGYVAPGESTWTKRKDDALVYGQRDAAEAALATLVHRKFAPDHTGVIQIDAALPKPKTAAEQRAEAKVATPAPIKGAKSPRSTAKPADRDGFVSLKVICTKLGVEPSEARKTLRKDGQRAPGGVWEWPAADVAKVEKLLGSTK